MSYLLFLMVATMRHALEEAARFAGLHKSQFSKMLKAHRTVAVATLERLSKPPAKRLAKARHKLHELPWAIAIIVDSTLQHRASLHPENAKTFKHGQGFVVGHQWTNVVVLLNDTLVPLRPLPFYSQRYCRDHALEDRTEHDLVVEDIQQVNLEDYSGAYEPREVIVLTDSGYDNKKSPQALAAKHWHCLSALGKTRSVQSVLAYLTTPKSKQWAHIATFFRNHRWLKWQTLRIPTHGTKRKRMEFRTRDTMGYLRYVGQVQLVCSEPRRRPEGRRTYFACNDMRVTARQVMLGYRLRWVIEIYQSCNLRRTLFWQKRHFFDPRCVKPVKGLDKELCRPPPETMTRLFPLLDPSFDDRDPSGEIAVALYPSTLRGTSLLFPRRRDPTRTPRWLGRRLGRGACPDARRLAPRA
jgi:DDE family transposase